MKGSQIFQFFFAYLFLEPFGRHDLNLVSYKPQKEKSAGKLPG